jgi:hypothetical protein
MDCPAMTAESSLSKEQGATNDAEKRYSLRRKSHDHRKKRHLATFLIGLAVVSLAAPVTAQAQSVPSSANERAAIHECSVRASKYKDTSQENDHIFTFHTCMAEHGAIGD